MDEEEVVEEGNDSKKRRKRGGSYEPLDAHKAYVVELDNSSKKTLQVLSPFRTRS